MNTPSERPHEVIHVRFFDAAGGQCFAESDVPAGQLPQSFEARTTLHLGEQDWDVVEARPVTAAEFRRSGELVLILRRVEIKMVDPRALLFSLPTICDALPPIDEGSSKLGRRVIEMHEDDWRQVEWVPAERSNEIDAELEAIRQVYETRQAEPGFKELHVRTAIPLPFDGHGLRLGDLRDALGPQATWLEGVSFTGVAGVIRDSFAVRLLSSIELYGTSPGGVVESICFTPGAANNAAAGDIEALAEFAATHDLLLVDWCAAAAIPPILFEYATKFAPADG